MAISPAKAIVATDHPSSAKPIAAANSLSKHIISSSTPAMAKAKSITKKRKTISSQPSAAKKNITTLMSHQKNTEPTGPFSVCCEQG